MKNKGFLCKTVFLFLWKIIPYTMREDIFLECDIKIFEGLERKVDVMEEYIAMCTNWMNKGYVVYVILGVAFAGFLSRFIAGAVYDSLVKDTENFAKAKSKFVKQVKLKYENSYKLNLSIHNNDAFVDKLMASYKICGISLHGFRKVSGTLGLFCVILLGFQAAIGGVAGLSATEQLWNGLHGMIALILLIFSCRIIDLNYKHELVRTNLLDYLENSLKNRMVHEYANVMVVEDSKQVEPERVMTPDIPLMKEQLSKVNTKETNKKKDLEDEEAVIQEILREFFA